MFGISKKQKNKEMSDDVLDITDLIEDIDLRDVKSSVWQQVRTAVYGSQDAGWLSYYNFFYEKEGLAEKAVGLFEVAKECGWIWAFDTCAIITDRPTEIRKDEEHRLHSEVGPALSYPGHFEIYAWNGTRVPKKWILDPDGTPPEEILAEPNVEVRAAGVAIVGMAKMLEKLDHKIIDSNENPEYGDVVAVTIPDLPEPVLYLKAECPRNGTIMEGLPPGIRTVRAAQAWRVGLEEHEFQFPEVRT